MALPHRYLLVSFTWRGTPKIQELEPFFAQATDWLRYAPNCWIVWTSGTPQSWATGARRHLGSEDSLLVVEINAKAKEGWQADWIWAWLNKVRPEPLGRL